MARRKQKQKGRFSKAIVIVCISEMLIMQIFAMIIAYKKLFDVTGLIGANHAVFGGELLLLCLKRIFAKENGNGNIKKTIEEIVES